MGRFTVNACMQTSLWTQPHTQHEHLVIWSASTDYAGLLHHTQNLTHTLCCTIMHDGVLGCDFAFVRIDYDWTFNRQDEPYRQRLWNIDPPPWYRRCPTLSPLSHLSPSRILWNCVAMRQAKRGPTRPPWTKGSATPPRKMSMLSGEPYSSRSWRARSALFNTWASCACVLGVERPQYWRHALYPEEGEQNGTICIGIRCNTHTDNWKRGKNMLASLFIYLFIYLEKTGLGCITLLD